MPQYTRSPSLIESRIGRNPLKQLERWLDAARKAGMKEPTAMTLATVGRGGRPSARMVLFKGLHRGRLTFYTNFESRKGSELSGNPRVALVFWWDKLERQLRVEGRVSRLPAAVAERYFHSRPRASQLGAITSRQSRTVANRAALEARLAANTALLDGKPVPLPDFWGGFAVTPDCFEFWQGQRGRLHDRLLFKRRGRAWKLSRLEP